jgi:single-strand DNA-binding protein
VAIKTSPSINGFIANDPRLTFNDNGEARFYARFGQNHYRREDDGSFSELEPTFHDLVQFGKGAELSAERFRKGDNFLAQGYVRDYKHVVDGQDRTDEQFVAKRLSHDPNLTTYSVDRRPRSEREAPAAERESASRNTARPAAEQAAVEHDGLGY